MPPDSFMLPGQPSGRFGCNIKYLLSVHGRITDFYLSNKKINGLKPGHKTAENIPIIIIYPHQFTEQLWLRSHYQWKILCQSWLCKFNSIHKLKIQLHTGQFQFGSCQQPLVAMIRKELFTIESVFPPTSWTIKNVSLYYQL